MDELARCHLLVPAGGRSSRLGGVDKVMLPMPDGRPVLAHVLAAPVDGARLVDGTRLVVGPERAGVVGVDRWVREGVDRGGPVAAIAAGIAALVATTPADEDLDRDVVALLAGDLPSGGRALTRLRLALHHAGGEPAVAVAVVAGRFQYLLAVWRLGALRVALAAVGDPAGRPVRALYEGADVVTVEGPAQWGDDLDTPDDARRLLGP